MKKSGASQSITSAPEAIATKDANGALSPITKPTVTDDPYGGYALGDVNGDGKINTRDAVMILKYSARLIGLDETQQMRADTNGDGKINTRDVVLVLKYSAGIITSFN